MSSLTDEQRAAIHTRNVSVALSAGAGCGKTFVLTERFLSHLEPDAQGDSTRLNQLVAITFTERAAREMRDRIRNACRQRLKDAPDEQALDWRELLRELDSARISTIHSFCGALLRTHAVEAKLDPRFRVLEQAPAETLLYGLIEQELRRRLGAAEEPILELSVRFNPDRLREMIAEFLDRRHEIDWAFWRDQTPDALAVRWESHWRETCLPRLLRQLAESPEAKALVTIAVQAPSAHPVMRERFAALKELLPQLPSAEDCAPVLERLREATMLKGGGTKKGWPSESLYEGYKKAATAFRKRLDGAKEHLTFDAAAARSVAAWGLNLLRIAESVAEAYTREKRDLGVLDFNDLLIHARDLLAGPQGKALRQRWASHLRLLLVDEFQDTDPLQVELVQALCDHDIARGKLFFVGDFKQSIYRFRGANPHVFRRLQDDVPPEGRLPLTLNFRSQPAILEFVNAVFREPFGTQYEELHARRPQVTPTPAVEFLWAEGGVESRDQWSREESDETGVSSNATEAAGIEEEDDAPAAQRRRRREAVWIARRIRAMLDGKEEIVVEKESEKAGSPKPRPVQAGDVALLFRALTNVQYYEEALRRYGIDYYLVGGHAFYAQQEIYDLLNLLQAVENPDDALSLAGVLRSPFFNLWDETVFWLARHPEGLPAGLFADPPGEIIPEQAARVRFAAVTLQELRALKDRLPIAALIQCALDCTAYDALLLAEFLGERKLANLKKLIDQARSFDQSGIFCLADFIAQLKDFVVRQPKEPLAATQPETASVVRLMTIHQAKGLEFPVVFVPDLDRRRRGPQKTAVFSPAWGPLVPGGKIVDGFKLYMQLEREEDAAEEVRLLYVAMTRAADYLVLSAGLDDLEKISGPWLRLLADQYDLAEGRPHGAGPRVNVVRSAPVLETAPPDAKWLRPLEKIRADADKCAAEGKIHRPKMIAPIPPDPRGRRQFSFSRLTGKIGDCPNFRAAKMGLSPSEIGESGRKPVAFLSLGDDEPPPLDPRGLGSLVHAVLAEVDFTRPDDWESILARHAELHLRHGEADFREPEAMIARFLDSARARQIARAGRVHRELEFLLAWPPGSTDPQAKYIQGYIDCLYQDDAGDWHLLDYKTNRVTPENLTDTAEAYAMQMLLYALAVETLLKAPPREVVLHFLRTGEEYSFPWEEQSRRRVVEIVSASLTPSP
ncbi:MAG: UvrD-helicase domain-containing protein [Pirellulales bacterium]|nr:UvrD-helicase domain-containing protein [Pirellulales bacterium]